MKRLTNVLLRYEGKSFFIYHIYLETEPSVQKTVYPVIS